MKNNFKKISAAFIAGMLMVPTAQAATLEERVAELEANQSLNIFNFSGTFITRFDDIIKAEQTQPNSAGNPAFDNEDLTYWRMKFQFNVDANVSKNIKFYSRMTTSKLFNSYYLQGYNSTSSGDLQSNNDYLGSRVVLEKAYVDITIPDTGFNFFAGRLPTVDGQPQNYKDGRARMGTYPLLSYDSVLDGIGFSYKMDKYLPQGQSLAFRALYTPMAQANITAGSPYIKPPTTSSGSKLFTNPTGYGLMLDYSTKNLSWVENMGIALLNFQTADLYLPPATGLPQDGNLTFTIGGTTLAWELNGIANTGWDVSLNYLASTVKSSGKYSSGAPVGFGMNSDGTEDGGVFLLATRYNWGTWILGGEYLSSTKNSAFFATAAEDLTNFYGTNGTAYHLYVTKKFTQNLALRLGYMLQDYDYNSISVGAPVATDRKIETAYANLRLDF